ncbi:hypothetical protein QTH09_17475 [Clostridium perfringens]|nr:hypothetical protein [Clostridium perfringens]
MIKRKKIYIFFSILIILFVFFIVLIVKNKCFSSNYDQLNDTDKKMLTEYNQLYEKIVKENLWADFDLADKTILAVSKDSLNTYMINPKNFTGNLFAKKITMPSNFKLQSVYRIASIVPEIIKIRLDIGSNFNTIGKTYTLFDNSIYFIKYDNKVSFEKKYTSKHFAPFLAHESFHYYMQNNWKIVNKLDVDLNKKDMDLLKEEYNVLDNIQKELNSSNNRENLINYSKQYVDIVSKRIESNKDYVLSEISKETAEGTAQYLTLKTSKLIGYDYGIMYFDNIQNVPFSDVFNQLDAGNLNINFLYDKMPYETGAQLCLLFDSLNIPNWQEKLNSQTLENPINLYDVLKDYLLNIK